MPTVVQENHDFQSGTGTTSTVTLAAPTPGNRLYAWLFTNTSSTSATAPNGGGWVQVPDTLVTQGSSQGAWYERTATGTETSVSVTIAGSSSLGMQVYEIAQGGNESNAATGGSTVAATSMPSPSITAPASSLVLVGYGLPSLPGSAPLPAFSAGWTNDNPNNVRILNARRAYTSETAGVSTTLTVQNSQSRHLISMFAVTEAAANLTVPFRGLPRGRKRGTRK